MNGIIIKNESQIAGIRKSCQLAAQTLKFIEPYVVPGVTTEGLDSLMAGFIKANGARSACLGYNGNNPKQRAFPKSTCISINEVVCHGIPNKTILKNGDIVSIDVTTILDGYYGDTAATFPVGEISEESKNLIEITKKCLDIGVKQVMPGRLTGEIGYHIWRYAMLQGCTVVEAFCGHGTGIEFHESPQICHISKRNDGVPMWVGMIFTIEPMINMGVPEVVIDSEDGWTVRTADGKLSAQFEHTILVNKTGCEILTL